ncbi:MAG: dnaE2 [Gammaproteobacteria bacterium]|nr:dnaE2 [Gammaproteobacteria bacterium]
MAGIVTHRQRPETASGVVFMSLEDETGISNLIVWPGIQATQRQAVFMAHLMVQGELQSEMGGDSCHCGEGAGLLPLVGKASDGIAGFSLNPIQQRGHQRIVSGATAI